MLSKSREPKNVPALLSSTVVSMILKMTLMTKNSINSWFTYRGTLRVKNSPFATGWCYIQVFTRRPHPWCDKAGSPHAPIEYSMEERYSLVDQGIPWTKGRVHKNHEAEESQLSTKCIPLRPPQYFSANAGQGVEIPPRLNCVQQLSESRTNLTNKNLPQSEIINISGHLLVRRFINTSLSRNPAAEHPSWHLYCKAHTPYALVLRMQEVLRYYSFSVGHGCRNEVAIDIGEASPLEAALVFGVLR